MSNDDVRMILLRLGWGGHNQSVEQMECFHVPPTVVQQHLGNNGDLLSEVMESYLCGLHSIYHYPSRGFGQSEEQCYHRGLPCSCSSHYANLYLSPSPGSSCDTPLAAYTPQWLTFSAALMVHDRDFRTVGVSSE